MPKSKADKKEAAGEAFEDSQLWDLPAMDEDVILRLADSGIHTIEMLRCTTPEDLMLSQADGGVGLKEVKAESLYNQVIKKLESPAFKTAGDSPPEEYIPTGSGNLDAVTGGGYSLREITQLVSAFGLGKTTQCMTASVTCWDKLKAGTLYIHTEIHQPFNRDFPLRVAKARNIEFDVLKDFHISKAITARDQEWAMTHMDTYIKDNNIKLVIFDSIGAHLRAEFQAREWLARRQQMIMKECRILSRVANAFNLAVILTNQIVASPDPFAPKFNPAFGNSLNANCGKILALRYVGKSGKTNDFIKGLSDTGVREITVMKALGLPVQAVRVKLCDKGIEDTTEEDLKKTQVGTED